VVSRREEALSRTFDLLTEVVGSESREQIDQALSSAVVHVVVDADDLAQPATQAAVYTLAMLVSRSGIRIEADLAPVPLAVEMPGLVGQDFSAALAIAVPRMFPGARVVRAVGQADIVVAVGVADAPPARSTIRLSCAGQTASTSRSSTAEPWAPGSSLAALASAGLGATEVHKEVLRPLAGRQTHTLLDPRDGHLTVPFALREPVMLGDVVAVSAGAIIQNMVLTLAAEPFVAGALRIMDRDKSELTNTNRCPYVLIDAIGQPKVDGVARWAPRRLGITADPRHLEAATADSIGPGSLIVVGADDISVRHSAQELDPSWLGIGATSHLMVLITEHPAGEACAGCAHTTLGDDIAVIPTMSIVSFWAGYLLALRLIAWTSGSPTPSDRVVGTFWPLRPDSIVEHRLVHNPRCPLMNRHRVDLELGTGHG
jgi:hypothetical protein